MSHQWPDCFAAVDLGASSGRVILGRLRDGRFDLDEVLRFDNGPLREPDGLHWDTERLVERIRTGLGEALRRCDGHLSGVGIDTWGVDYGRLDAAGRLLEQPFHYRDSRTQDTPRQVFAELAPERLYGISGLQVMPFNTIFQYVAQAGDPAWPDVDRVLLMPDLLAYRLCGREIAEVTIASTTGLLDVVGRQWSPQLGDFLNTRYHLPFPAVLPDLVEPGTVLGPSLPGVLSAPVPVIAVGGHDTASAVAAVPADSPDFAFVSSGTWSLVGLELDRPVLTEESRQANFTNELGVDHTVRYLKNVMGMWVLNECLRAWRAAGLRIELASLLDQASALEPLSCVLDMDDERLIPPGDMPARLVSLAQASGQHLDTAPAAVSRCVMDSLALAYRKAIRQACELSGRSVGVVHIVGGGSLNTFLCQLTAESTGLTVLAGPAEGTALGNLLVQARAVGALSGGLRDLRRVAIASSALAKYRPGVLGISEGRWADAQRRIEA